MIKAYGYPSEYLLDVKWYQAMFAQFFDVFPSRIRYVVSQQQDHQQHKLTSQNLATSLSPTLGDEAGKTETI
jgi:hypothetical protein